MNKYTSYKIASVLVPTALFLALTAPTFAATTTASGTASTTATANLLKRSAIEIGKREDDLGALQSKIQLMNHLDDATKASIAASLQSTVASLESLKSKIENDTDKNEMKNDVKSIADSTRVYMLIAPQARILAAADRIGVVADMITALDTKLQTRISAAQTAGKDVSAITPLQSDIVAKIADAKTQATTAITAVSGLIPDGGDQTKLQANQTALKTARTALTAAEGDLNVAQKDIKSITAILKSVNPHLEGENHSTAPATSSTHN